MMLWDLITGLGSESEIERWEGWEMKDEVRMEEEGVREKGETRVLSNDMSFIWSTPSVRGTDSWHETGHASGRFRASYGARITLLCGPRGNIMTTSF